MRLDIQLEDGSRFECEDLRFGCEGQIAAANHGGRAAYSFVAGDNAPAEDA